MIISCNHRKNASTLDTHLFFDGLSLRDFLSSNGYDIAQAPDLLGVLEEKRILWLSWIDGSGDLNTVYIKSHRVDPKELVQAEFAFYADDSLNDPIKRTTTTFADAIKTAGEIVEERGKRVWIFSIDSEREEDLVWWVDMKDVQ